MLSDNQSFIFIEIYYVSLRRFAQLSSADAVYMANRETTYNRKVSAPPLGPSPRIWKGCTVLDTRPRGTLYFLGCRVAHFSVRRSSVWCSVAQNGAALLRRVQRSLEGRSIAQRVQL